MSDITVNVNGYRVNLRVGAVVARVDEILLCRMRDQAWWFLPGGRIKTNESSLAALNRELSEEIGDGFRVIRPAVCAENFFCLDGQDFHEICFFYEVEWIGGRILQQQPSNREVFDWVSRPNVSGVDLKPDFIKEYIANPRSSFELVIHRDGEQAHAPDALPRAGDA